MWFPLAARPKLGSVAAVPVSKQPFVVQAREEKPLLQDGWFDSGDVAVLDEDNIVRLTDRAQGRHQVGWRVDQFDRRGEPGDGMSRRG